MRDLPNVVLALGADKMGLVHLRASDSTRAGTHVSTAAPVP